MINQRRTLNSAYVKDFLDQSHWHNQAGSGEGAGRGPLQLRTFFGKLQLGPYPSPCPQ